MKIIKENNITKKLKIKEVSLLNMGQSPSSNSYTNKENGFPFFQGVAEFGYKYPIEKIYTNEPKKWAKKDDILFSVRAPVGKVNIANKDIVIGRGLAAIKNRQNINRDYLYFKLISDFNEWKKISKGSIFDSVNKKDIEDFEIVLIIDQKQQEKIASVLSKQERQIEIIETLIEKLEKRNQYYAEKLLSGEKRIRKNDQGEIEFYDNTEWQDVSLNGKIVSIPKGWVVKKVENIANLINGYAFKKNEMLNEGSFPIIKMNNFKNGKVLINKNTKYSMIKKDNVLLKNRDLIIGLSGSIGEHAIFDLTEKECFLNQRCLIIRSNENQEYLNNCLPFLIKEYILKKGHGGVISNLSHKDIAVFEMLFSEKEHKLISDYIHNIQLEKEILEKLLIKEKLRFQWMLDNLLSGEYQIVD